MICSVSLCTFGSVQVVPSYLVVYLVLVLPLNPGTLLLFSCQSCLAPTSCFWKSSGNPRSLKPHWFVHISSPPLCLLTGLGIVNPSLWSPPLLSLLVENLYAPLDPPLYKSPWTPVFVVFHPWALLGNKLPWKPHNRPLSHSCLWLQPFSTLLCLSVQALLYCYSDRSSSGNSHPWHAVRS